MCERIGPRAEALGGLLMKAGRGIAAGFTLIELVLVMGALGVLALVAAPRFGQGMDARRLDACERRILADIEHAGRLARARSASVQMVFDGVSDAYVIVGATDPLTGIGSNYAVRLGEAPYRIDLRTVNLGGDWILMHDGYGTRDSGGTIEIQSGGLRRTITIGAE